LIKFPVFNVADACITISGAIMILLWIFEAFEERKSQKSADNAESVTL
jgi:lipoprotein signal peptidase